MDEIFTGTNTKEGLSAAYAICKELLKYKNNITIITTHFNLLTSINNIENYKTIINRDDKNNIIYILHCICETLQEPINKSALQISC